MCKIHCIGSGEREGERGRGKGRERGEGKGAGEGGGGRGRGEGRGGYDTDQPGVAHKSKGLRGLSNNDVLIDDKKAVHCQNTPLFLYFC